MIKSITTGVDALKRNVFVYFNYKVWILQIERNIFVLEYLQDFLRL